MGTILCSYGNAAYDHEGYAAQVLDDGTITGTYSNETRPRMIGRVVAACDCGWRGTIYYPSTGLCDEDAEDQALAEWQDTHAIPTLEAVHATKWERLRDAIWSLYEPYSELPRGRGRVNRSDRLTLLNRTQDQLDGIAELVRELRKPLVD